MKNDMFIIKPMWQIVTS